MWEDVGKIYYPVGICGKCDGSKPPHDGGRAMMAKVTIEVPARDISDFKADDRGRITLGSEYAGKTVEIAVLDSEEAEN
jgi:hypothetical protein